MVRSSAPQPHGQTKMAQAAKASKKGSRRLADFLTGRQVQDDRERARRIAKIKKALAGAKFANYELDDIEQVVFLAYGRTKL